MTTSEADHSRSRCPFCGETADCEHLVALIDLQYGEVMAGLLYDNPLTDSLIEKIDRIAAADHARNAGKELRRIAQELSKLRREVTPKLEESEDATLKQLLSSLRSATRQFQSPARVPRSTAALREMRKQTEWTPCEPGSFVRAFNAGLYRYLISRLKEAGAQGEIHEFHGGQVGMTADVCNLYANDPEAVVTACESMLGDDVA